ncbi:hypothetical protein BC833DRAFT_571484 [Globomyces pollinis-pini]|nr:hypothetical protein BC833DRAFT_571484 [Globomyces pollinis-pini]
MEADTNNDILSILVVSDEKVYSWELPEVNVSITLPDKKIETLNHESTIGSLFFSGLKHRPFNEFRSISVVGDCVLKDLSVENDTTIETTTGSISIENLDSRNLRINATVGSVKVNASMIKDFCAINTITGSSKLVDVAAKNILLSATTGSIRAKLNNVQTLDCSTTMGSIHTDLFIADTNNAQIKLQSTTGSISSELTGFSGKFDTRTSFGSSTIYGADTISTEKNNTFGKIGRSGGILTALVSTGSLKLKFN